MELVVGKSKTADFYVLLLGAVAIPPQGSNSQLFYVLLTVCDDIEAIHRDVILQAQLTELVDGAAVERRFASGKCHDTDAVHMAQQCVHDLVGDVLVLRLASQTVSAVHIAPTGDFNRK